MTLSEAFAELFLETPGAEEGGEYLEYTDEDIYDMVQNDDRGRHLTQQTLHAYTQWKASRVALVCHFQSQIKHMIKPYFERLIRHRYPWGEGVVATRLTEHDDHYHITLTVPRAPRLDYRFYKDGSATLHPTGPLYVSFSTRAVCSFHFISQVEPILQQHLPRDVVVLITNYLLRTPLIRAHAYSRYDFYDA